MKEKRKIDKPKPLSNKTLRKEYMEVYIKWKIEGVEIIPPNEIAIFKNEK